MQVQPSKFHTIDQVFHNYLQENLHFKDRWLFEQTLYTATERRTIFDYFPFQPYSSVLDAGTGFGAFAFGLAGQIPITVHGVDYDESKLNVAKELHENLVDLEFFQEDSSVYFCRDNLYNLSYENDHFDFAISRFVYQHLQNPEQATRELYRVVRPGGYICLIDIDDQFSLSYPPPSDAMRRLEEAFIELQARNGGDRYVGRKLSTYLHRAGFEIQAAAIQPQAAHVLNRSNDLAIQFVLNRFSSLKDDMIANGLLDEDTFEQCLESVISEKPTFRFNSNAQVITIARKPERETITV